MCEQDRVEQKTTIYPPLDWGYGFAHALKNGLMFEAGGWVNFPICDDGTQVLNIALYTENGQGFEREEFNLISVPLAEIPNYYELPVTICDDYVDGTSYTLLDFEHIEDHYIVDYSTINWVSIDVADTISNVLRGRFQLRFIIDPDREKMNPENPDVVEFTEGTFDLKFFK